MVCLFAFLGSGALEGQLLFLLLLLILGFLSLGSIYIIHYDLNDKYFMCTCIYHPYNRNYILLLGKNVKVGLKVWGEKKYIYIYIYI